MPGFTILAQLQRYILALYSWSIYLIYMLDLYTCFLKMNTGSFQGAFNRIDLARLVTAAITTASAQTYIRTGAAVSHYGLKCTSQSGPFSLSNTRKYTAQLIFTLTA